MIRPVELGAVAQMTEPISKMMMAAIYIRLTGKQAYNWPAGGWKAIFVRKYALPYQATSERELKSVVIRGMAVAGKVVR